MSVNDNDESHNETGSRMPRKEQMNKKEVEVFNNMLVRLCQAFGLEFAVAFAQGRGPLEIFNVCSNESWRSTIQEMVRRVKAFSAESTVVAGYPKDSSPDILIKDMTEEQAQEHMKKQLLFIDSCATPDTVGAAVVIFGENGLVRINATNNALISPEVLRELADQIESRQKEDKR